MPRHRWPAIAAILVLLLTGWPARTALARATLIKAEPAPDSVLRAVPPVARLWFNEPLDPALSRVTVWGPRGVTAVSGTGGVDQSDPTRRSMVAALRPLRTGLYTVRWRAAADDLAVTSGSYTFTVRP